MAVPRTRKVAGNQDGSTQGSREPDIFKTVLSGLCRPLRRENYSYSLVRIDTNLDRPYPWAVMRIFNLPHLLDAYHRRWYVPANRRPCTKVCDWYVPTDINSLWLVRTREAQYLWMFGCICASLVYKLHVRQLGVNPQLPFSHCRCVQICALLFNC